MIDRLYGLEGDEHLRGRPTDVLDDMPGDAYHVGNVVEVCEWEALPDSSWMPSVGELLDHYRELVYDEAGEDAIEDINWSNADLIAAAQKFVDALNRQILWKKAGRLMATHRYQWDAETWTLLSEEKK